MAAQPYDSFLLVCFGGPDGPDDVMPFLQNVLRDKNVPRERLEQLAEPYMRFGGASPINQQNRALLAAIANRLSGTGGSDRNLGMAVYWANLHWHPFLADVLRQMADDGCQRTLAFVTSAYGSYPGCRQYRLAIDEACRQLGHAAPQVDKLRLFYNHPGFVHAVADRVVEAYERIDASSRSGTQAAANAKILFTAHSLPVAMARECPYQRQVHEACRLVVERLQESETLDAALKRWLADWQLVYQSRSGPPNQAWLGPDVGEWLSEHSDLQCVLIVPIGFLSDHMEVIYDLDVEVQGLCDRLEIEMVRAGTVGTHPRFVRMIRELVEERRQENPARKSLGPHGPWPDECPEGCCSGPESIK